MKLSTTIGFSGDPKKLGQRARDLESAGIDTDAWTAHHGYTPLHGSLNPSDEPPLDETIVQWHLFGGGDTVVRIGGR